MFHTKLAIKRDYGYSLVDLHTVHGAARHRGTVHFFSSLSNFAIPPPPPPISVLRAFPRRDFARPDATKDAKSFQ